MEHQELRTSLLDVSDAINAMLTEIQIGNLIDAFEQDLGEQYHESNGQYLRDAVEDIRSRLLHISSELADLEYLISEEIKK